MTKMDTAFTLNAHLRLTLFIMGIDVMNISGSLLYIYIHVYGHYLLPNVISQELI